MARIVSALFGLVYIAISPVYHTYVWYWDGNAGVPAVYDAAATSLEVSVFVSSTLCWGVLMGVVIYVMALSVLDIRIAMTAVEHLTALLSLNQVQPQAASLSGESASHGIM